MATQDIFGRRPLEFGGAFAADGARIELSLACNGIDPDLNPIVYDSSPGSVGLLTQQLNISYQQPITRLYEVGTQKTYYVVGRPQGTVTMARVFGPGIIVSAFYQCIGDACNAVGNDLCLCLQAGCNINDITGTEGDPTSFDGVRIGLTNVLLQALGFSIQAQDMVINENLNLFFTNMMIQDSACQYTAVDLTPTCFA